MLCCPMAGGLLGCSGGCFRVFGHLVIEESSPKTKLLTQYFKNTAIGNFELFCLSIYLHC